MSNNLPANLSDLKGSIMKAKQRLAATTRSSSDDFLRLTKAMDWEFGADDAEVKTGSKWAINPQSFQMGYIAWHNSEVQGEAMASIHEDPITQDILPAVGADWDAQVAFQLRCVSGEDKGHQVMYKTTSRGGKVEFDRVLTELLNRLVDGEAAFVPIVKLEATSYKHKKFGKIVTPIFDIVDWKTMDDEAIAEDAEDEDDDDDEAEDETAPKRRKRRKVA